MLEWMGMATDTFICIINLNSVCIDYFCCQGYLRGWPWYMQEWRSQYWMSQSLFCEYEHTCTCSWASPYGPVIGLYCPSNPSRLADVRQSTLVIQIRTTLLRQATRWGLSGTACIPQPLRQDQKQDKGSNPKGGWNSDHQVCSVSLEIWNVITVASFNESPGWQTVTTIAASITAKPGATFA